MYNMDEREEILVENFEEYYSFAVQAYDNVKYNAATTLFFKAIVALCDLYIFRKEGFVPSSHSNRFRILEDKFPDVYAIADKDFPFYQDSYTHKMDKETAELLKDDTEKIKEIIGL